MQLPLADSWGRVHRSLRVSVTDRCNIRCFYCMPAGNVVFRPRAELLTFEEITRFVRVAITLGITRVRVTGGEPLVRAELPELITMLARLQGLRDLALTTNGILLPDLARPLREAGLERLNISLDTLDESTFETITRRSGLQQVLAGIEAAVEAGFDKIRINALAIRGLTDNELPGLVKFAMGRGLELRFIEYMPLDADGGWQAHQVLTGDEIKQRIEGEFGPLIPVADGDPSQPATDFRFASGIGTIGFINPVSQPFCTSCDRLRLTAEGQVRNCLFSSTEWDVRSVLRGGDADEAVRSLIRACVSSKKAGHGIDSPEFTRPQRAMYQIGG